MIVVPEKFNFPRTNVLTYNGSDDSVFAIKLFAYLFPELCKNETLLVYVKEDKAENIEIPDQEYIEELAARHFPNLTLMKLRLDPKKYFSSWVMDHEGAILISGAFSRSVFSQMFRKSFVADVITNHRLPVFIAHR